jgi:hypothetical protein
MQRGSKKGVGDKETRRQGDKETRRRRFLIPLSPLPLVSLSRIPHSLFVSFAFFAFIAFFSPLFAQQSRKAEVIRLGQEFDLKINQEAVIEGEGLAVVFESVIEDGRCPEDVTCVWSGNAKIKVRLSKQKRTPGVINLNTDVKPKSSSYLDYEIRLVALKPLPKKDKPVQRNEYKATLIITKK